VVAAAAADLRHHVTSYGTVQVSSHRAAARRPPLVGVDSGGQWPAMTTSDYVDSASSRTPSIGGVEDELFLSLPYRSTAYCQRS